MCNFGVLTLCVIVAAEFCFSGLYASSVDPPGDPDLCPSTGLPKNSKRRSNTIEGNKPVFRLDVGSLTDGYIARNKYNLFVRAQDSSRKFGDVQLSVTAQTDGCGTGMFDTNPSLYYQPTNCSQMVYKNTRNPEHTFIFSWTAPSCGCVLIRARVTSADSGAYFLEDENILYGHLTKRVCPIGVEHLLSKVAKPERINLLCKVTRAINGSEIAKRPEVLHRRKMDYEYMSNLQKEAWKIALERRAYTVKKCCGLINQERVDCLGDDRRRRIDHFCAYGESIIPFTVKRQSFMMAKKKQCCWRLGESRYHCFSTKPLRDDTRSYGIWNVQIVEYMDEAEPINDLEDYSKEVIQELSKAGLYIKDPKPKVEDYRTLEKLVTKPSPRPKAILKSKQEKSDDVKRREDIKSVRKSQKPSQTTTTATTIASTMGTTTKATEDLKRKIKRYQIRLECCNQGQQYGAILTGDPWELCSDNSWKYAKTIKRGRRKCRTYYLRCCIEEYQNRKKVEEKSSDGEDDDDDDNTDTAGIEQYQTRRKTNDEGDGNDDDDNGNDNDENISEEFIERNSAEGVLEESRKGQITRKDNDKSSKERHNDNDDDDGSVLVNTESTESKQFGQDLEKKKTSLKHRSRRRKGRKRQNRRKKQRLSKE